MDDRDDSTFLTGLGLGKNTYKAKRERALAPTKAGEARCDPREQLDCETCFAIEAQFATYICLYGLALSGVTTVKGASRILRSSKPKPLQYSRR